LGRFKPDDVAVQLYLGRLDADDQLVDAVVDVDARSDLLDGERLRGLAARDGLSFDADEEVLPVRLHGRAGAVVLEKEAGLRDRGLLQAVRDHVTGRPGMGGLSCVLYAADYLEPGRGFLSERERLRALGGELEDMVRVVLRGTIGYLERHGRRVARVSRELEKWLIREGESDGR
jgi:HD superfamily phosphohydrolase YqeK